VNKIRDKYRQIRISNIKYQIMRILIRLEIYKKLEIFDIKFFKSILVFLFMSSTLSAFYCVLKLTNKNICQYIIFIMYSLAIKVGLIALNISLKLYNHQPNLQLVSRVLFIYNRGLFSFWITIVVLIPI
jgi:hypothetical protein